MVYLRVIGRKYDQFGGRAGRREFWLFAPVHVILSIVAGVVDRMVFGGSSWYESEVISAIYGLFTIVPTVALCVRRLHDVGRNGWYLPLAALWGPTLVFGGVYERFTGDPSYPEAAVFGVLALVFLAAALVGSLILVVFALLPGNESENKYGLPAESPNRAAVYWTVLTTRYRMFRGRAGRKEFWLFVLVSFMLITIARWLDLWLFPDLRGDSGAGPVSLFLFVATIAPTLALAARRLHDVGLSAWWLLLLIPPITPVGLVVLIVLWIMPSQRCENKHGSPAVAPA